MSRSLHCGYWDIFLLVDFTQAITRCRADRAKLADLVDEILSYRTQMILYAQIAPIWKAFGPRCSYYHNGFEKFLQ